MAPFNVKTASGRSVSIEQLSNAEAAIRTIALNNGSNLCQFYGTSRDDLDAVCELAHEMWFRKSKEGGK